MTDSHEVMTAGDRTMDRKTEEWLLPELSSA